MGTKHFMRMALVSHLCAFCLGYGEPIFTILPSSEVTMELRACSPALVGVSFLHVKAALWGNPPNRVLKSLERGHGELFRRFHLQIRQNADVIDNAGDNLSVESDSLANQRNQTKVLRYYNPRQNSWDTKQVLPSPHFQC